MHVLGSMLQSQSLAELGEILQNVAVLCTTTYENRARESFNFLNAVFTARQDAQEILYENVRFDTINESSTLNKCVALTSYSFLLNMS